MDLYHAREHLHSLTRSLEFMLPDRRDEWLAARPEDLDCGDIDGIEAAVRRYPLEGLKKDEAEAGCKTVIGQRLKQSGMHWTVPGADSIIALRCREASSQWERIWQRPRNQTATA